MSMLKLSLPLLIALLFSSGCSETSSSSTEPAKEKKDEEKETQAEQVDRISLTGLAIKGLVKGAAINVYALADNGQFNTSAIGTGASNSQGEYQLLLSAEFAQYTGPVKVVLSHLLNAEIQCDDPAGCTGGIAAGDFYPMPTDFELSAIAQLSSGLLSNTGDSIVNLTALTTLATSFIESDTITADTINQGNNQVRAVLSLPSAVDLTTTRATNIVNSESTGNDFYGAINAAFQRIANDSGRTLTQVIADYASTFENGQIVYKSNTDTASFKSLIDATINLGQLSGADLTKAQGIQQLVDSKANDEDTNIIPPAISIGDNQSLITGASITLTATTLVGSPVSYSWQVISGEEIFTPIIDGNENTITFNAPLIASEISVRVIAKDASGLTDNDILTLSVMEAVSSDSSLTGDYHGVLLQRGFASGEDTASWRELFSDSELMTAQNWRLSIDNAGIGSLVIDSGISSRLSFDTNLELADTLDMILSEQKNATEQGHSFSFIQAASGHLILNIPAEENIDIENQTGEIYNQRNFEILKFAESSYLSRNIEKEFQYGLLNNEIQFNELKRQKQFVTNLVVSKKHALNDFTSLSGKHYVGMEHSLTMSPNNLSIAVTRFDMSFNDALGNVTLANEDGIELAGLINRANTEASDAMHIAATSNQDETFNVGTISQGLISFNDPQGVFQLAVNPSQTAILGIYNDWSNNDGTNDFTSSAVQSREAGLSVYLERPAAPVALDGKTFLVQSLSHYYELAQAPISVEEITGRLYVSRGTGSISFAAGNATFNLTEEEFVYRYPNDNINQSPELVSISQPLTTSWTWLSPAETASDGCFSFSELGTTLFCTNGQSMVMREHNNAAGNLSLDKYLTLYTGALLP